MRLQGFSYCAFAILIVGLSSAEAQQRLAPIKSSADLPINQLRGDRISAAVDDQTKPEEDRPRVKLSPYKVRVDRRVETASAEVPIQAANYQEQSVLESAPEPVVQPEIVDSPAELIYEPSEIGAFDHPVGGCDSCGSCVSCRCGDPHAFWIRAEYLMWWTKGMRLPPLVTTSAPGTPADQQGVLGFPTTTILYGNDDIFEELRKGGRVTLGFWFDACQRCGLEGDFLGLHDEQEHFQANCFDYPILDRPFFRVDGVPRQSAQIVCGPNLAGQVEVAATTRLYSGGIRFVSNRCCNSWGCDPCGGGYCGTVRRDFLLGYRFTTLNEALGIREQLNTLGDNDLDGTVSDPVQNIDLRDSFVTDTQFHGIDFGWRWEYVKSRWSLDLLTKIAIGGNRQNVRIDGQTLNSLNGNVTTRQGGLLTQPSNIGSYSRNRFSVIPEIGVTGGFELRPGIRLTAGYSFLYWTNVVRPGDQVDFAVNAEFLQGNQNPSPRRPLFDFRESDYWAQGLNFGVDLRF